MVVVECALVRGAAVGRGQLIVSDEQVDFVGSPSTRLAPNFSWQVPVADVESVESVRIGRLPLGGILRRHRLRIVTKEQGSAVLIVPSEAVPEILTGLARQR